MKRKVYFFVFSFLLSATSWGWTSAASRIGSYVAVPYQSSNPTVELKKTRAINQNQSEECYLFAYTGALEIANANGWHRQASPEFSGEYLFVQKLLSWAEEALVAEGSINNTFYFLEGGDVHHGMKLSLERGLLPQEFFQPRIRFADWNMALLYQDVQEIVRQGRKIVASAKNTSMREQVVQLVLKKVQERIAQEAGTQSQQFTWGGRQWDVHQFEDNFGMKRNSHIYMLYAQGVEWAMGSPVDFRRALVEMVKSFGGAFNYRQVSWNQIWQYLIYQIDNGMPALLSVHWGRTYHVLNVVGYEYNNRNEIVSFKLKNSWGEEYGDKGYAFFGLQDLQKNITNVWGFDAPK